MIIVIKYAFNILIKDRRCPLWYSWRIFIFYLFILTGFDRINQFRKINLVVDNCNIKLFWKMRCEVRRSFSNIKKAEELNSSKIQISNLLSKYVT